MDSIPLSQPAPSHTNTPTSARQRALLSSIFNASRNGTRTNDGIEGPYRMMDDTSAGQRHGLRLGTGTFRDHAGRLGARIAALTSRSRSRSRSRGEPTGQHYVSTGSYVPINLHSRTADNHWGDRATSSSEIRSEARSGRSRRDGRTRNRQPRRNEDPEPVGRSCTSVIGQKELRKKLCTLAIAGIFFIVVLAVYIAFSASHAQIGRELRILLIFMLLILAIVFCHAFVRFALAIARGPIVIDRNRIPSQIGPGGYAEPNQPIPVALAADEEAMAEGDGNTREKVTAPPPAYGLWRSSVRINPNLLHWQRVENAPASQQNPSRKNPAPRPPSYASDNGVDYVIEAQPRSCVPDRDRISEHP